MPAISSASAVQSGFQQLKLQEARRNAMQAEQTARSLTVQAQSAQRVADRAQETARSLYVQSGQAQEDAGRARQGLALASSVDRANERLVSVVGQAVERSSAATRIDAADVADVLEVTPAVASDTVPASLPSPVVNTRGQLTGTLVSTTA